MASATAAQSVVERTPNLSGGWLPAPGVVQFNLVHRFSQSGPPERKVASSPLFHLAVGLPGSLAAGAKYATHSEVAPGLPNEWEFFGRYMPVRQDGGAPVDVAVELGYNLGPSSADAELTLARRIGPLRLLGGARAFSSAYAADETRFAAAGGASVRLREGIAIAGDLASLLDRRDGERMAWGAGLQLALPYTPHTLSLHVTNVNAPTLQGSSRGRDRIRYGFEFTVPLTLRRYLPGGSETPDPPVAANEGVVAYAEEGDTVVVAMSQLAFSPETLRIEPGTTVVWRNDDPVMHTATANDGSWDSGEIEPGEQWSRTFGDTGEFAYHCVPHPFMTGTIIVEEGAAPR